MVRTRIAAVVAWIIGALAVAAGARVVVLSADPGYHVIDWLVRYNLAVGLVTVLVTAVLIWRGSRYARAGALATLAAHGSVLLILVAGSRDVVAVESLVAMSVRVAAWLLIYALLRGEVTPGASEQPI
jgi:hypothetical protein